MFSKIHEIYRIYWNHHQKHACEIWGSWEKLHFLTEKCLQRRTFKTGWSFDIFSMFSKIHVIYRIYWNHHQKHACEIWGSLEMLQFLREKCRQHRTFKTGWNFDIHSMFSKIHETYRIYWNHHQKHACEIWGSSEKLQFLTEKCLQRQPSKQDEILTFSQCSQKFRKFTEFIGITTRNKHVKFEAVPEKLQFLTEKCLQRRTFKTGWNFDIFSMFSKIHEFYRIYWNHHQKHACEIWGSSEKLQFLTEKCLQRRTLKTGWNLNIFSMFSKIHEIYRIYWNHHQKHACEIWGSSEKLQFLMEKCLQHQTFKAGWSFDNFSMFSKIHEIYSLLESPPETCMWNLRQFGEITILDGKMPTAPDLQNRMKFWHFLNVLKNSWNLQNLLESPPETCMWNLRQFGDVTIFDGKMPTAPILQNRMKF